MRRVAASLAGAAVVASLLSPAPVSAQYYTPNPPGDGVVITDTGLVLPVRQIEDDGYVVTTPCWNEGFVRSGTHIAHVDAVIDPGHGGSESGAVGNNGLAEKNLNLAIAELVRDELRDRGFSSLLTRTSDMRIPVVVRAEIARALKADVFVSIHHNGGNTSRSSDPGTEIYHQYENPNSKRLAGILYEGIGDALSSYEIAWRRTGFQGATALIRQENRKDLYGILQYTPGMTSVITEAGYLSNPAESRLLADPAVQRVEAVAIADGIVRYLTTDDPGSGYNPTHVSTRRLSTGSPPGCVDPQLESESPGRVDPVGFADDQGGAHQPAIDALGAEGIFAGTECGPDLFCPGHPIRRWMMAVWLVRTLDETEPAAVSETRFADTGADRWWSPYAERLAELDITKGCSTEPARFCPYDPVTRDQMASFLARAFKLTGGPPSGFIDITGNAHASAIDAVAAARISRGCTVIPPRYCPGADTTKAQMATFMARGLRLIPRL